MNYCLRSRLSPRYLAQADEIKVDYRDHETIPDLAHRYTKATIVLFPPIPYHKLSPEEWNQIVLYNQLCNNNFIINCGSIADAYEAKQRSLRFMLDAYINTEWDLRGMINLGAEYAYVGIPFFFNMPKIEDLPEIKLRAVPTVSYQTGLPHNPEEGVYGKWIRPEDIELYEDYITTIEFEQCLVPREETLFKVYKSGEWSTRLDVLIEDLGSSALNRAIDPDLIERRINCGQRCMRFPTDRRTCHACSTALKLAEEDNFKAITAQLKEHIEK